MEKISYANINLKAVVALLISDRLDFRKKKITKYEEAYYTVIKGLFTRKA